MFEEADVDGSGELDREELATLTKRYLTAQNVYRSSKKVQELVNGVFEGHAGGKDVLAFHEFIGMLFEDPGCIFHCFAPNTCRWLTRKLFVYL